MASQAKETAIIELPGLLMLRLMSRCNQKCRFCMVEDEIQDADDIDFQLAAERILAQPDGTRIEFFGGEPTIYPHFLSLLRLARSRGLYCTIASNGRAFNSQAFTRSVTELGPDSIYIRTSLYGDTPELHDFYTRSSGSYRQTIRGIRNLAREGVRLQVNVVILARNVDRLSPMTEFVSALGVPRIKFGSLVGPAAASSHAVSVSRVRAALMEAIDLAERRRLVVTVEKTPVCVTGARLDLVSTERLIGGWTRFHDDEGECLGCLVRRWCDGCDPHYVAQFGPSGLQRITSVPRSILTGSPGHSCEPDFLKHHCVETATEDVDESEALAIYQLAQKVEAKYGLLVVFPSRYVFGEGSLDKGALRHSKKDNTSSDPQ
jgi:molybdenum cofactor biosynthesis enzyme MoaA